MTMAADLHRSAPRILGCKFHYTADGHNVGKTCFGMIWSFRTDSKIPTASDEFGPSTGDIQNSSFESIQNGMLPSPLL